MEKTIDSLSWFGQVLVGSGFPFNWVEPVDTVAWSALMFVVVLGILVFIHEMGHYLAARMVGVRVNAFSIGFGPEIAGFDDRVGTRWKICAVPLGGYVDLFGFEGKPDDYKRADRAVAFCAKNVWARMWVVFAGPLSNFVLSFALLAAVFLIDGEQKLLPKVGELLPDMPAAAAGLQPGDLILSVNGVAVDDWESMRLEISQQLSGDVNLMVDRGSETINLTMRTQEKDVTSPLGDEKRVGLIGITPSYETATVKHPAHVAVVKAAEKTWEYTALTFQVITRMVSGKVSTDNIGGPLMIAEVAGDTASVGIYPLIMFMAAISVNLGLINLFPIPVLDGGHLLFYLIELLKGSPVGEKTQEFGFRLGLGLIMCLMIFAFYNDLMRIFERVMGS